jgi:hypothetical protein
LAYWAGEVNSSHLSHSVKISAQQAKKYLAEYQQHHPENLKYCPSQKAFLPQAVFKCSYIDANVNSYLNWLYHPTPEHVFSNRVSDIPNIINSSLNLPPRAVEPLVMRGLVKAIKQQRRIDVGYVSLSNPDGEGRIIQPHVFVKTGLRYHLRAYDEKHKEFRDFVLSRFTGEPDLLGKATHHANQDEAWNTKVPVMLAPDQRLSTQQKRVIERDYQMQNGTLVINSRAALVQYLLQEMQVSTKFIDIIPEAQQLVLVNLSDIKQWLFNT